MELSEQALRDHENSPSPIQKVGRPRLKPLDSKLYRFYELLVLFKILQHRLGCTKQSQSAEGGTAETLNPWQIFVNQLCWLCDFTCGGDSSTSIAVEDATSGPRYWLAVNFDKKGKALEHLEGILQKLSKLQESSTEDYTTISTEILQSCLQFSSEKFDNYHRQLLKNISFAQNSREDLPDSAETKLLHDLKHVLAAADPSELSTFAFNYVKSNTVREVHAKYSGKAPREAAPAWYNICHYIGRFGAWARAVKVVVHFVRDEPQVTKGFQVRPIPSPLPIAAPPEDRRTKLEVVFRDLFPREPARAEAILAWVRQYTAWQYPAWKSMKYLYDIDEEFALEYESKTFRPRTHAEVLLLDYFSKQELDFFNNDGFVGSSKPSCYCCDLYFKFHQGVVVTRSTHGNAWPKWCLPPGMLQEHERKLEWDGKIILKSMTDQIQSDILQLVDSNVPRRARVQDSTNGVWTAPTLASQLQ